MTSDQLKAVAKTVIPARARGYYALTPPVKICYKGEALTVDAINEYDDEARIVESREWVPLDNIAVRCS